MSRSFYATPSNRQLKVGETIKRAVNTILSEDLHNPILENTSAIITEVKMSADLKIAHIFLLPMFGTKLSPGEFLNTIKESSQEIKRYLSKRVSLRYIPELKFTFDDTFEKAARLDNLLKR